VLDHLHESLGLKYDHFRWVPHALNDEQKAKRVRYAEAMMTALDEHSRTRFHYPLTGDESWMTYDQSPTGMRALDRSCVDERVRPTNHSRKTMVTVVFGVDAMACLDIRPAGAKSTADYFCEHVADLVERVVYPNGRRAGAIRHVLHFDNAPVHNAERVQRKLEESSFRRLEHLPDSPDLAPCDFFLFGYLHERRQVLLYDTVEEPEQPITRTIANSCSGMEKALGEMRSARRKLL
jgi:hypothetical protein